LRCSPPNVGIIALDRWQGGVIYTHNLVRALSYLPPSERPRVTLFCRSKTDLFADITSLVDDVVVFQSLLDRVSAGTRFEVLAQRINAILGAGLCGEASPELARAARRARVDAVFPVSVGYTRLLPNPIAWIPDLQHCFLPEFFSHWAKVARNKSYSDLLCDPERHVVFSSRCALNDARRMYGMPRAKTHVLHFRTVPLPCWFQDPTPVVAKYKLPSPYIIVCNQFWIHKDHLTAFKAVAKLKSEGRIVNLVCTGPTQDNRNPMFFAKLKAQVKKLGIEPQVHILGVIPRVDQVCLIRASKAVLQPSRFEGWSTVLEDARALGKPVIASDFPAHVEQAVPGCSFFRVGDAEDCARTMASFLMRDDLLSCAPVHHEAQILHFAKNFMAILNTAFSGSYRPSAESQV
jgi:glycosyltransferase involved in cell wall biosynthesis